jgi:hypothetical protein
MVTKGQQFASLHETNYWPFMILQSGLVPRFTGARKRPFLGTPLAAQEAGSLDRGASVTPNGIDHAFIITPPSP